MGIMRDFDGNELQFGTEVTYPFWRNRAKEVDLKTLMIDSKRISKEHGFETGWENFPEKLMLIVSELSEALEEERAGRRDVWYRESDKKPEGIGMELADAVIRIAELAESLNIDLPKCILEKQTFNESRPFKHGKQF